MTVPSIEIPDEVDRVLESLASKLNLSKAGLITEALSDYVETKLDILDTGEAYKEYLRTGESISWEDVKREAGLIS